MLWKLTILKLLLQLEYVIVLIPMIVVSNLVSFQNRLFLFIPTLVPLWHIDAGMLFLKDVKNNVVFVSRNYFSFDRRRRTFRVGTIKWPSWLPPNQLCQLQCKVEVNNFCSHENTIWHSYIKENGAKCVYVWIRIWLLRVLHFSRILENQLDC